MVLVVMIFVVLGAVMVVVMVVVAAVVDVDNLAVIVARPRSEAAAQHRRGRREHKRGSDL
jgi:hypothetical protein